MRLSIVIFFLMVPLCCSFGQNHTISGYIQDQATGENLIGATVYSLGDEQGTVTNYYGFFSLTLPEGVKQIVVSYVGYKELTAEVNLTSNIQQTFKLSTDIVLEEVVITAEPEMAERTQMSTVSLSTREIKSMPALLGEVDVLKTIQLMPGIQSGSEGSSGLYVRGGGPDQNLILLDGVPVYNASHLFGFFSVFNADAINNVNVIKGGFPARYGGRLSSVIDISMKEGNNQEFHGEGSIGLVSSKLTLEGPIKSENTSFIVSGRRTYIDALASPIIRAAS
ncbi:MAG: carboxypeptidase-like regulatory domain-containing protein, partial [Bacteroidota bacterium]